VPLEPADTTLAAAQVKQQPTDSAGQGSVVPASPAVQAVHSAPAGPVLLSTAERRLLQLYMTHLQPSRDQLVRFRRGMKQLMQRHEGDAVLDRFWTDYEVRAIRPAPIPTLHHVRSLNRAQK
jgi:hypothetical protein